jgi:hypothetical protein
MQPVINEPIITLDLTTWAFLGGTIVPILVGLLTKLNAPSALRGLVNLILSAVAVFGQDRSSAQR